MAPPAFTSLAITGLALLGSVGAPPPAALPGAQTAAVALLGTEALIVGPSGTPIPSQAYIDAITSLYVDPATPFPGQPVFPFDHADAVFTPEGLQPLDGIKVLPLDTSVAQGTTIVDATIAAQIAAGNNVVVSGYSQSSTIASEVMKNLLALPQNEQPTAGQLSFSLLADPSNPDGGLLSRFGDPTLPPLTLPSLGLTFSGATPSDTPWDTAIYTREYDGFADFPKYPINFLATLNAFLGMQTLHGGYLNLTPQEIATAVSVPTSEGYVGATTYWMIPTENLPLLAPIRAIPIIGTPLADLLQPDLKVLVNLGYGPDPNIGWSTTGANLPTPFGLFPSLDSAQFEAVLTALAGGAQSGVDAFTADLSHLSLAATPAALAALPSLTDIVNAFTAATSAGYSSLLGLADIGNALLTSMPLYDVNLLIQELSEGNLLNAVGMPIAADVALGTLAGGFSVTVITNAITGIENAFSGLF